MGTEIVNRDLVRIPDITWYLQKFNKRVILCVLQNEGRYCVICPVPFPRSTWCVRGCHLQLWLFVSLHRHPVSQPVSGYSVSLAFLLLFLLLPNYLFIKRCMSTLDIVCAGVCVHVCVCVCVCLKPRP
jgi:hypothetical protein